MSIRFSDDPPDDDAYDVPLNATCADCGVDYAKAEHDRTNFCDDCSNRRDAHTSALEVRMLAQAVLRSARPIKDVA